MLPNSTVSKFASANSSIVFSDYRHKFRFTERVKRTLPPLTLISGCACDEMSKSAVQIHSDGRQPEFLSVRDGIPKALPGEVLQYPSENKGSQPTIPVFW